MTELAKWVVRQRKQGKRLRHEKPTTMTLDQYKRLESIGFKWKKPRRSDK